MKMKFRTRQYTGFLLFYFLFVSVHCYRRIDVRERAKRFTEDRVDAMHKRISERSITESDGEISVADLLMLQSGEALKAVNTTSTAQGFKVIKLQEFYKNVPVIDGSLTVEVTDNDTITGGATGTLIQDIEKDLPDVTPTLSRDEALAIAISTEGDDDRRSEIGDVSIELVIYPWEDEARLVYIVKYLIESLPPNRPLMVIDAFSGDVLIRYNALNDIENCTSKSLHGFGGNEKMGKIEYGKAPYCIKPKQECFLENKYVRVVSMNHSYTETETSQKTINHPCNQHLDSSEKGAYSQALDAFFYGTVVSKMYEDWIGGFPLHLTGQVVLRIHFGVDFDNAFWNGRNCSFGDGNTTFYPLVSLDVVGHEIGHGVVHQNSMLSFGLQARALNEGFSDILGLAAMTYFHGVTKWNIGAQIMKDKPYLRSFEDPESDGSISHIDNFTSGMNMSVHKIGGPIRLAFHNIVTKHNVTVKNAFRSFDRANKVYWTRRSTLQQAGCGVIKAAYDLGQNVASYEKSFDAVGIVNCSVFDYIPRLHKGRWYKGIVVSTDSQPVFNFKTENVNGSVTILALGANMDIEIRIDDDKESAKALNFNFLSGKNKLTFEANKEMEWYVGLFPVSESSKHVSLMISFTCDPGVEAILRAVHECEYYQQCDTESLIKHCF